MGREPYFYVAGVLIKGTSGRRARYAQREEPQGGKGERPHSDPSPHSPRKEPRLLTAGFQVSNPDP